MPKRKVRKVIAEIKLEDEFRPYGQRYYDNHIIEHLIRDALELHLPDDLKIKQIKIRRIK